MAEKSVDTYRLATAGDLPAYVEDVLGWFCKRRENPDEAQEAEAKVDNARAKAALRSP